MCVYINVWSVSYSILPVIGVYVTTVRMRPLCIDIQDWSRLHITVGC